MAGLYLQHMLNAVTDAKPVKTAISVEVRFVETAVKTCVVALLTSVMFARLRVQTWAGAGPHNQS